MLDTKSAETNSQAHPVTLIECEPTVDISVAEELYQHLEKALEQQHVVEIDAKEVERVDAAILQVFLAFIKHAEQVGLSVTWKSMSGSMFNSIKLLGLVDELKAPEPSI